jgi:hypothetical protein
MLSSKTGQSSKTNIQTIKKLESKEKQGFSDSQIQNLFFEFNISLLEAFDESKHFLTNTENGNNGFLHDVYISDSKPDIRKFLNVVVYQEMFDIFSQNLTFQMDCKIKNEMKRNDKNFKPDFKSNTAVSEAALIPNFDRTYNLIKESLKRRTKNKSCINLLKIPILNTISIPSPKMERLPYTQNDIFSDPINYEILRSVDTFKLGNLKVDYSSLNLDLRDQYDLNRDLIKDELQFLNKDRDRLSENNLNSNTRKKGGKDIFNMISSMTYEINIKTPITQEFKMFLTNHAELVKMFYGFYSSEFKNLSSKKKSEMFENLAASQSTPTGNNIIVRNHKSVSNILQNKEESLKLFHNFYGNIKDRANQFIEFHLNFAVNMVKTHHLCEFCFHPNTIWEIRKELIYVKSKGKSYFKCKFCEKTSIPYFYIIEESLEDSPNVKKMKKNNKSFESNNENSFNEIQFESPTNIKFSSERKMKKIEFFSLEHILEIYNENSEIEEKTYRVKKFLPSLFYNVLLLLGEVKIKVNEKTQELEILTLDSYIKRYLNKKYNEVKNNTQIFKTPEVEIEYDTLSSSSNIMKIFKDNYLKRKKELEEEKRKLSDENNRIKLEKDLIMKDKLVNFKFDIKDLMNEERFKNFENDLKDLPQINKNNIRYMNILISSLSDKSSNPNLASPVSPFRMSTHFQSTNPPEIVRKNSTTNIPLCRLSNQSHKNNEVNKQGNKKSRSRSISQNNRLKLDLVDKNIFKSPHRSRSKKSLTSRVRKLNKNNSRGNINTFIKTITNTKEEYEISGKKTYLKDKKKTPFSEGANYAKTGAVYSEYSKKLSKTNRNKLLENDFSKSNTPIVTQPFDLKYNTQSTSNDKILETQNLLKGDSRFEESSNHNKQKILQGNNEFLSIFDELNKKIHFGGNIVQNSKNKKIKK